MQTMEVHNNGSSQEKIKSNVYLPSGENCLTRPQTWLGGHSMSGTLPELQSGVVNEQFLHFTLFTATQNTECISLAPMIMSLLNAGKGVEVRYT